MPLGQAELFYRAMIRQTVPGSILKEADSFGSALPRIS